MLPFGSVTDSSRPLPAYSKRVMCFSGSVWGQQVARFVVGIAVITAFGIAFADQTVVVVIVEMQDNAVRTDECFLPGLRCCTDNG